MASFNKVIALGNCGKDPEVRYMTNGSAVTNVSIACSEKYKDKQGQMQEVTEWLDVAFFGKLGEIAGEYLKKGSAILVEGKLKTEKYTDKQGVERNKTKIIASSMTMVGGKGEHSDKPKAKMPESDLPDDDIPF